MKTKNATGKESAAPTTNDDDFVSMDALMDEFGIEKAPVVTGGALSSGTHQIMLCETTAHATYEKDGVEKIFANDKKPLYRTIRGTAEMWNTLSGGTPYISQRATVIMLAALQHARRSMTCDELIAKEGRAVFAALRKGKDAGLPHAPEGWKEVKRRK